MDAAGLCRALDDLAGCPRRDKKIKMGRVLSVLQDPKVIVSIDQNSELRHMDSKRHLFTWNSCLQLVTTILMDEVHTVSRTCKGQPTLGVDLQQYFKLLAFVVRNGSRGNLMLDLNELVTYFLNVMKDPNLSFIRVSFFRIMQLLFRHCESHSIVLTARHWDDMIFWCCAQLSGTLVYNAAHLLCLILSHANTTYVVPWDYIWNAVIGFCKRCADSFVPISELTYFNHLGWIFHLLRWLVANVHATRSHCDQLVSVLDTCLPKWLNALYEHRAASRSSWISNLPEDQGATSGSASESIAFEHLECSAWITSISPHPGGLVSPFNPWTSSCVADGAMQVCSTSDRKSSCPNYSPRLVYPQSYFHIEPFPSLCSTPLSCELMKAPEQMNTTEEFFSMCRWFLLYHIHSHRSVPSQSPPFTSLKQLIQYVVQQWQFILSALQFQQDATRWKQIRSLRNYFGFVAVLVLVLYDGSMDCVSEIPELRSLFESSLRLCMQSNVASDPKPKRQRLLDSTEDQRNSSNLSSEYTKSVWELLALFLSSDNDGGYLWWLVLDWFVRLKWQQHRSDDASSQPPCPTPQWLTQLITQIAPVLNTPKAPLAQECMLIALHTCIVVVRYELERYQTVVVDDFSSALHTLWSLMLRFANLTAAWSDPFQASGRDGSAQSYKLTASNLDRLAYENLTELILLLRSLPSSNWASQMRYLFARQLSHRLNRTPMTSSGALASYLPSCRIRFLLVSGFVLRDCQLTSTTNLVGHHNWPLAVRSTPCLTFFLQQYLMQLEHMNQPDSINTVPHVVLYGLLVGLYWASHFTLNTSTEPPAVPLSLSDLQSTKAIDFLLEKVAQAPPCVDPDTDELIQVQLLCYKLQLYKLRSKFSSESIQIPDSLSLEFRNLLSRIWNKLAKCCNIGESGVSPPDHLWRAIHLLFSHAYDKDWYPHQSERTAEFLGFILRPAAPLALRVTTPASKPTQFAFGDDEFTCGNSASDQFNEFDDGEWSSNDPRNQVEQCRRSLDVNRLQLLQPVLSFAIRTNYTELVHLIQTKLVEVLTQCACGDTVESIEWFSAIVRQVNLAVKSVPSVNVKIKEELYAALISCLVDALREAFKARLTRGGSSQNYIHLIHLMQAYCQLVDCLQLALDHLKLEPGNQRWISIGRHMDQLCQTVWAVSIKRAPCLLHGLEFWVTTDCLMAWIQLRSSGLLDERSTPEYCLSTMVQHSVPTVLFRLTDFLQRLIGLSENVSWKRKHSTAVLQLLDCVLRLLAARPLSLGALPASSGGVSDQFEFTICLYRLILRCSIGLEDAYGLSVDQLDSSNLMSPGIVIRRPRINCVVEVCTQLTKLGAEALATTPTVDISQCSRVYSVIREYLGKDTNAFLVNVRPYLLLAVLSRCAARTTDSLLTLLKNFPWPCWGFNDYPDACSKIGAEIQTFLLLALQSDSVVSIGPLNTHDTCLLLATQVVCEVFTRDGKQTEEHTKSRWNELMKLVGGSTEVLSSAIRDPCHVTLLLNRMIHLIAFHGSTTHSIDRNECSIMHMLYDCLTTLVRRIYPEQSLSVTDSSVSPGRLPGPKCVGAVQQLFNSTSDVCLLVEQLFSLGSALSTKVELPVGCSPITMFHCVQLTAWIAIANLITIAIFDHESSSYVCPVHLKDFAFWRLIVGHLEWLASELATDLIHVIELLSSLKLVLSLSQSHTDPARDVSMEVALHHAVVAHLVAVAITMFQHPDTQSPPVKNVLNQVSDILLLLVGMDAQVRFQTGTCELPNFPRADLLPPSMISTERHADLDAFFAPFQTELEIVCSCPRASLLQEITLLSRYFDYIKLRRCPQFGRFQSFTLLVLEKKLTEFHALKPISIDELERRIINHCESHVLNPINHGDAQSEIISAARRLVDQLEVFLFSSFDPYGLPRDNSQADLVDTATREAGLLCMASLHRIIGTGIPTSLTPSAPKSLQFGRMNPQLCYMWQCLIDMAHFASNPNSSDTAVSAQVLRRVFVHCGHSLTKSLSSADDDFVVDMSLYCILWPYLKATGGDKTDCPQFDPEKEAVHQRLASLRPEDVTGHLFDWYVSQQDLPGDAHSRLSRLTIWLLNLPLVLDPVCLCLKPVLEQSTRLCQRVFPWLVVLALSASSVSARNPTVWLKRGLIECIHWSLTNQQSVPFVQHLYLDSFMLFHQWKQWITIERVRNTAPVDIQIDWLLAAECAIKLQRAYEARLCFELAWLDQDSPADWLTVCPKAREIWLGLCRSFRDLPGLQAAQIEFLSPENHPLAISESVSVAQNPSLLDETRLAVNELLGNWSGLLVYHDRSLCATPNNYLDPQAARCLQQMGAKNLLKQLVQSDLSRSDTLAIDPVRGIKELSARENAISELQEMRMAIAWRLSQWDTTASPAYCRPTESSLDSSSVDWISLPSVSWNECGWETVFYWILQAANDTDWKQVATILSHQQHRYINPKREMASILTIPAHQPLVASQQLSCIYALERLGVKASRVLIDSSDQSQLITNAILPVLHQILDCAGCSLARPVHDSPSGFSQSAESWRRTQPIETFLTASLRFVTVLVSKIPDSFQVSDGSPLRARLAGLVRLVYLRAAELALYMGSLRQADDWLEDASQMRCMSGTNACSKAASGCLDMAQSWHQLKTIELSSLAERVRGEHRLATHHLQTGLQATEEILAELPKNCPVSLSRGLISSYVHGVTVLCNWLFESRTKSAADLLTNYLEPAIQRAKRCALGVDADAWASLARFADAQFASLETYLSSSEFAARRQLLAEAQRDVACLTDLGEKSRLLRMLQRQSAIELEEMETLQSDADRYLQLALDSYSRCLSSSDAFDLKIYRFVSLWLSASADPSQQLDSNSRALKVNQIMTDRLPGIRSDKFLPLVPQLAVRLSSLYGTGSCTTASFQATLTQLVERIVDEHPHHSAFVLLFLVNAKLDDLYSSRSSTGSVVSNQARAIAPRTRVPRIAGKRPTDSLDESSSEENGRILAARRMFERLSQGRRGKLLRQMQSLSEAYVEWANADVDKHRGSTADIPLPADCKLQRFVMSNRSRGASRGPSESLDLVAIPTSNLAIDRSGLYPASQVVFVAGFAPTFRLAGGINVPKIVTCLGSDGRARRQLVKGRDDPRQDAVMQQVFSAANSLFTRRYRQSTNVCDVDNTTAFARNSWLDADGGLRMRTYKVLPVAERSGVIEWCENTVPLGEWLAADRTGAHQRYRPRDMGPNEAKQRLAAVRDRPPERRRVVFEEITDKLKPVLAYFYLEQFPDASSWCRARAAYTRSLAVSSLVGYLVGLGDRHPHNILLHRISGELVHIDLGVAFDQGRLLPTPEMVPFRLTRDLVHALGPLGLQTGFVPAAEAVLAELRTGGDVILTLLQVLLHDPLYSWSLTPAQLCALEARRADLTSGAPDQIRPGSVLADQTNLFADSTRDRLNVTHGGTKFTADATLTGLDTSFAGRTAPGRSREPVNQLAERVLLNVRGKLEGRVTGNLAASSDGNPNRCGGLDQLDVAGHVGLLVRAATDPTNLSRMYFGWQAYL